MLICVDDSYPKQSQSLVKADGCANYPSYKLNETCSKSPYVGLIAGDCCPRHWAIC